MYNTSSATSMREEDDLPRRPFPWRAWLIVVLLVAAGIYAAVVFPPRLRAYRAEQREVLMAMAGMVAESIELQWDDQAVKNPEFLTEETIKLFDTAGDPSIPSIAFARVSDRKQHLICEITRAGADNATLATKATLPDLGVVAAIKDGSKRLSDTRWLTPINSLQMLIFTQGELSGMLGEAANAGAVDELTRNGLYSQQDLSLSLAESLADDVPELDPAIAAMQDVLRALTHGESPTLRRAYQLSADAESALTMALEGHRATIGERFALPSSLTKFAPPPPSWLAYLRRTVEGRRVLVPLFLPDMGKELAPHLGWCEVVFYEYPADLHEDVGSLAIPPLVMLLVAVGLAVIRPRRKRVKRVEEVE